MRFSSDETIPFSEVPTRRANAMHSRPMRFSPNGTSLCQPRPSAWVIEAIRVQSPNGATLNSTDMKHPIDNDEQRIGPPRWGFLLVVVIVTQADGLG
jgi:hypothetical protein